MLEPQSRRLLLESFAPPPGHRLDWAVGTTYSLDLIALLAAPIAFAFSDWQDRDGRPVLDPLALLKATREYAGRMLIFCQAGRIHVPRADQPLLHSLEGSIAEAIAPHGGSFHPKVWFLRYLTPDETVTYRLLCLSRNMTFDRSWDTVLSLEGTLQARTNAYGRNHPLGQFVESLPTMLQRSLAPVWRKRMETLAYELRRVDFELPEPFEEIAYWPIGTADRRVWPFPDRIDRMLVISPFVDGGFIERLAEYDSPKQLLSRPESLDGLAPGDLDGFDKFWVLDEMADPEPDDGESSSVPQEAAPEPSAAGQAQVEPTGLPLLGLHAKAYIAEAGWDSHLWTGSANATQAAFEKNVEFLVQLTGKKSRCGINAILERPERGDGPHAACLADLLREYRPTGEPGTENAERLAFDRLADELVRKIVKRAPVARCEPDDAGCFALNLAPTKPGKVSAPSGYAVQARPISFRPESGRDVNFHTDPWCRFEKVSMMGLTAFFAWKLASDDGRFEREFVLHCPLDNAPADRKDHLLRALLCDRDRVLRFLLLLLMNPDARGIGPFPPQNGSGEPHGPVHGLFESTLFESLLRALKRNPEQIDHVEQIIADLQKTPEGRQLLPENLEAIWEPIVQVRREQRQQVARKTSDAESRRDA